MKWYLVKTTHFIWNVYFWKIFHENEPLRTWIFFYLNTFYIFIKFNWLIFQGCLFDFLPRMNWYDGSWSKINDLCLNLFTLRNNIKCKTCINYYTENCIQKDEKCSKLLICYFDKLFPTDLCDAVSEWLDEDFYIIFFFLDKNGNRK